MKRKIQIFFLCICLFMLAPTAFAADQHLIMNFATINELNWAAPEEEWQQAVKPQVISQIREMRNVLDPDKTSPSITLGWSTLMEYMNVPLDTPSPTSSYVIKVNRILDIAEQENFPVFIPLNGFQWWDNLPELYNWWDPDGTRTDPAFFARQKDPENFKRRFIAGYNPENVANVEWQSWKTPMKLNYRNWGGGGFRLAPPPNLARHSMTQQTYRSVQEARFRAIVRAIANRVQQWHKEGKQDLFIGMSIGTEVSLNASILPSDEFEPYGYRGIQDSFCPPENPDCGNQALSHASLASRSATALLQARAAVVSSYLSDLSRIAVNLGLSKNTIYTHVWSEALPGEKRYTNYAQAAFNPYARAGMSFYGYAKDPLSHPDWKNAVMQNGKDFWGAVEYSAGTSAQDWKQGLTNTFTGTTPASIMVIYNWQDHSNTAAVPVISSFLATTHPSACTLPVVSPVTPHYAANPATLSWNPGSQTQTLLLYSGIRAQGEPKRIPLTAGQTEYSLSELPGGIYTWAIETTGCNGKTTTSTPYIVTKPHIPQEEPIPWWVETILNI